MLVRFKSDEQCPCPGFPRGPINPAVWDRVRGKSLIITVALAAEEIRVGARCGSDTYWEVNDPERQEDVQEICGIDPGPYSVVCRHVLDIGD